MSEQCELMQKIYEYGLVLTDCTQFIDTHPNSSEAKNYYNRMCNEYNEVLNLYSLKYGEVDELPWECECGV